MDRNFIMAFLLVLITASCNDDNDPTVDDDSASKVIGENIYRILQGNDQTGAFGQVLPEGIEIEITDLQGNKRSRNLTFETSDPTSEVVRTVLTKDGTFSIQWKLGCDQQLQTLTILDNNVCGIAKSGCIEVEIFKIRADAGGELTGWFESCETLEVGYDHRLISNDQFLVIASNNVIYSTSDPIAVSWSTGSMPQYSGNQPIHFGPAGEIYYKASGNFYLSSNQGKSWSVVNIPNQNYYDNRLITLENGDFVYARRNSPEVSYSSDQGKSWDVLLNISKATDGQSLSAQALVSDGNRLLVVADNNKVIALQNADTTLHEFVFNTWPPYASLSTFEAISHDNKIFLNNGRTIYILDLSNNTASGVLNIDYRTRMIKPGNQVYLVEKTNNYWQYENGSFVSKTFSLPESLQQAYSRISSVNFFKGSPVFIDTRRKLFYLID